MPASRDPLEPAVRAANPAARLVPDRAARRADAVLPGDIGPPVRAPGRDGQQVVLLVEPDDLFPGRPDPADCLRVYWRDLVQAAGTPTGAAADAALARFAALGPHVLPELRAVLAGERVVEADAPDATVAARAAGLLAELRAFDPGSIAVVFPSLAHVDLTGFDGVDQVDVERLKPAGAADGPRVAPPRELPPVDAAGLARTAQAAADAGNFARAAVAYARVPETDPGHAAARAGLRRTLADGLVYRLGKALGWGADDRRAWARALEPVAVAAAGRIDSSSGRALYDLQRVAEEAAGGVSRVEPVGYAVTLGRRDLRRPLPAAPLVARVRHLRAAREHLHGSKRLAAADRHAADALFARALHDGEHAVAAAVGPVVRAALREAGLTPASAVEAAALDGTVARLVERLAERGFLRFGDLRDALARSDLKMADLAGPGEWLRGDALLRADRLLGHRLPGVYQPGELYLRLIHRVTAAAFGTRTGRLVWRFLLFPAAAAVLTVEFAGYVKLELQHLARFVGRSLAARPDPPEVLADAATAAADQLEAAPLAPSAGPGAFSDAKIAAMVALALVVVLLVNSSPARRLTLAGLRAFGRGLRLAVVAGPAAVWGSRPVRAVRRNRLARAAVSGLASPLVVAAVAALVLFIAAARAPAKWYAVGAAFALTAVLVRTGPGRRAEARAWASAADVWRDLTTNLLPGLVAWVLGVFRAAGDWTERGLYAVDEYLRYREGQSGGALAGKAVLAAVWAPVSYVTRFAFNILIEPQINPVKHFPVVTVSHKMLLPLIGVLANATGLSLETAGLVIFCIPGAFGFIAWELRADWRLYAANRSPTLEPAVLGHHGETVRAYLRPGFHSGTVPKLFRRLRADWREARLLNRPPPAPGYPDRVAGVADTVRQFLRSDAVALLCSAPGWHARNPAVGAVRVNVRSIEAELTAAPHPGDPVRLLFRLDGDDVRLLTTLPAWADALDAPDRAALDAVLAGLSARAGAGAVVRWADWVRRWGPAPGCGG